MIVAEEVGRTDGGLSALEACQQVAVSFCELLDAGDTELAFELHCADLAFFPPGAPAPLDRAAARAGAEKMRNAYAGRRTLHVVGNFFGRQSAPDRVEAQYVVTVYELTRNVDGRAQERETPTVFALAHERVVFVVEEGRWRYREQRMVPIAPQNPFGGGRA